jgi:hypothetical protein
MTRTTYLVIAFALAVGVLVYLAGHDSGNASGGKPGETAYVGTSTPPAKAPTWVQPLKATSKSYAYSAASDIEAYIAALPDSGNGNVPYTKARAVDECAMFASRPNFIDEMVANRKNVPEPHADVVKQYAVRTAERCKAFVAPASLRTGISKSSIRKRKGRKRGGKGTKLRARCHAVVGQPFRTSLESL